jgi:hypothetical protein
MPTPPRVDYIVIVEDPGNLPTGMFAHKYHHPSRETQLARVTALLVRYPDAKVTKDIVHKLDKGYGDREIRLEL